MSDLPEVDLVCIYLGGNDWFTLDGSQHKHSPFVTGFAAFLSSIRELRPLTPILVLTADERSGTCLGSVEDQKRYSQTLKKLLTTAASDQEGVSVGHVDCAGTISVDDPSDWGLMAIAEVAEGYSRPPEVGPRGYTTYISTDRVGTDRGGIELDWCWG